MKTVLHFFTKDLHRFRYLFLAWFLLLLAQVVADQMYVATHNSTPAFTLSDTLVIFLRFLLPIAKILFPLAIVPAVVQSDSVRGSTAFWMTRPIEWPQLLGSKLLTLFAGIILPQLITQTILMALHHISLAQILLANAEILFRESCTILVLMALATVTANFAQYALTFAGGYIGLMILQYIIWFISMTHIAISNASSRKHYDPFALSPVSLDHSKLIIYTSLLILTAFGVIVLLYRRRIKLVYGVLLGVAGLLLATSSNQFWKTDFLWKTAQSGALGFLPESFQVSLDTSVLELKTSKEKSTETINSQTVRGRFTVETPDASLFAEVKDPQVTWTLPSRTIHPEDMLSFDTDAFLYTPPIYAQALKQALQIQRFQPEPFMPKQGKILLSFHKEEDFPLLQDTGTLSGDVTVTVYKYVLSIELPLRNGAHADGGIHYLAYLGSRTDKTNLEITVNETTMDLLFRQTDEMKLRFPFAGKRPLHLYLLVNRLKGEALFPSNRTDAFTNDFFQIKSNLETQNVKLTFQNRNQDWLEQAVLVRVDREKLATFTKSFAVSDFSPKAAKPHVFDSPFE